MNISQKLPIGVQSFKVLREDHYLYVDKPDYLWKIMYRQSDSVCVGNR